MADANPKHVVQRRLAYMGVFFTLMSTARRRAWPAPLLGACLTRPLVSNVMRHRMRVRNACF